MNFVTKTSNIIIVILQMKIVFQQTLFLQHSYVCLNEKPHLNVLCEITLVELFICN
jgi:hypothetical protein